MATVISISNQKGGVGKTTTTYALSAILQDKGFRVLAVDLDPQSNLTFSMAADSEASPTIYDVFKGTAKVRQAIQSTEISDIIPSNILLSGVELEFTNLGREYILSDALRPVLPLYDYILIDTPPALSILTINAFTTSDYILMPMHADIFSLQGMAQLYDTIERVKLYCNPKLQYAGILLTRCNTRTKLATEVRGTAELLSKDLGIPLFTVSIRNSVAISESQSLQENPLDYVSKNPVMQDYIDFADEMLQMGI
ncbi:MAG: AAA family ATPase [Angelakisella sp.]